MRPFIYQSADGLPAAVKLAGQAGVTHHDAPAQFLGGGTTLLDLMKLDVMRPERIIDINPIAATENADRILVTDAGVRLGALTRMAQAADHEGLQRDYPVLVQSLSSAASAQLRNMATLGGNVLQRTRCTYFRDTSYTACNKRIPGSGCAALEGVNRQHAILGASDACIATYPGDFAQALMALDAQLEVHGHHGRRMLPFADLHRRPGETPHIETSLAPGELIGAIVIPAKAWARRSLYLKIRDRQSYEFALASAAVALDIADDTVRQVRIALGGVATVPWRAQAAEAVLVGKRLDEATAAAAADAAFATAQTRTDNSYKLPLGKKTLVRALLAASRMEV